MHERSFELVPIIHEVSGQDSFKTERIGKEKFIQQNTNIQHE